jgi:predicted nuclease with TOPRIM domain
MLVKYSPLVSSDIERATLRAANESSRAELGLTQARLKKIRVEPSRAHETVRAEKPSSNSARYYSS